MRTFLTLTLAGLSALAAPAAAQSISQSERDRLLSALHASRKMFLDSLENVSQAQWTWKPDDATWSVAECAEHIVLSEEALLGIVTQKILKTPAAPEKKALTKGKDETILKLLVERSQKFQAPEFLKPTNRWKTPAEMAAAFKEKRERTLDYVRATEDPLREHFADHPAFKTMDAYQWLILLAGHSERHTLQLLEVKANPGYPKQ